MINPLRSEWLLLVQSTIGWAILAVRAAGAPTRASEQPVCDVPDGEASIRLRATITIDFDAVDHAGADRERGAIQQQFQTLRHRFPQAALVLQRRKPRTSRRPHAPTIVVTPYADD